MAHKGAALIAAGVLGAFAGGLLLGRAIAPNSGSTTQPNSQQVARRTLVAAISDQGCHSSSAVAIAPNGQKKKPSRASPIAVLFSIRAATNRKPVFQFTKNLDDSGDTNYGDYVR